MTQLNNKENEFLELIQKNLSSSGFPGKSVQFPLEKMYELADTKGVNLNNILDHLKTTGLEIESTTDKIVFNKPNMNPETFDKAKEMMDQMSPEELAKVQEQVKNMTPEQQEQMMEQAKKMGLL
jgi:predicted DNA-binding protein YlxM (UPF0122 family)